MQVFTPKAAALFVLAGTGIYFYFRWEKQALLEQKRESTCTASLLVGLDSYKNTRSREGDGIALRRTRPRRWAI